MNGTNTSIFERPKRWDAPLSGDMTDDDLDRILERPPFSHLDETGFTGQESLRNILRNDARILRTSPGDIIVRQGDWGSSAYFVLSGAVRVEVEPPGRNLPPSVLGRSEVRRRGFFSALAQLWSNHPEPEARDRSTWGRPDAVGSRGEGEETRIFLQDVPAVLDRFRTVQINAGEIFGELAALGRTQRMNTVFAETEGELLEIRWQGLRDLIRKDRDGRLRAHIDRVFRARGLETFLKACDVFRHVGEEGMQRLIREAQFSMFGSYDAPKTFKRMAREGNENGFANEPVIFEEGDYPNGIVVIRSGLARLVQRHHHGHRTLGYLTPGQVFGFEEIKEGCRESVPVPLRNSLRALGFLTAVMLPTTVVEEVVLGEEGPRTRPPGTLTVLPSEPVRAPVPPHEPAEPVMASSVLDQSFIEFLVAREFDQGSATMLIDLDRCTRCDDCVRACASAHDGNPRFVRHGPSHGGFMIATACMHCSDPVCMIECPTGAIHRDIGQGSVVVNEKTCIGCSACANNCPYNAIRMVHTREPDGTLQRDEASGLPLRQATKCDLCVDQLGGPACQRACPHDALFRLDMHDLGAIERAVSR